jgi:hypothetical protein
MRFTAFVFVALLFSACSHQPVFHVTSADSCDRPSAVGTIGNKEYSLNVKDPPLSVACPGILRMADVGKDFPATVDLDRGEMTLEIAGAKKVFEIDRVREKD